jgi:hypothetical protein
VLVDTDRALTAQGVGEVFRIAQHWGLRFGVAFAAALALFAICSQRAHAQFAALAHPGRPDWRALGVHALLLAALMPLCHIVFRASFSKPELFLLLFTGCVLYLGAILSAALTLAPAALWAAALRALRSVALHATGAAALSVGVGQLSQTMWRSTAAITFDLLQPPLQKLLPTPAGRCRHPHTQYRPFRRDH